MRRSRGPVSERVSATSAEHVIEILRIICKSDKPKGVVELREEIAMPASTVHRAMTTLEEVDFVHRYRGQPKYVMGQSVQHLSQALFNMFPLRPAAHENLVAEAKALGITLVLSMRVGWYVFPVAVFEATNEVYHAGLLGVARLLHEAGAGRAVLEAADDAFRDGYRRFARRHSRGAKSVSGHNETSAELHGVLVDGVGTPFAVLSGLVNADADATQVALEFEAVRDRLARRVAKQPELARSPYEHIPSDDIVFTGMHRPAG